jgi:hypothetical protein
LCNIANICIFIILYDFACCLHNCVMRTEVWKSRANREPVCVLENCQWCGEPCFAGAAISLDDYLLQIPRRDKHKSLYSSCVLCGGSI